MVKSNLAFNAVFQKEVAGGYSVWVDELPGCTAQGETFEEALHNMQEAIALYFQGKHDHKVQTDATYIHNHVSLEKLFSTQQQTIPIPFHKVIQKSALTLTADELVKILKK